MNRDAACPFLLFDLGGVLIENAGFERMQALLPRRMTVDALKARWLSCEHVRAFERGRIAADVFADRVVDDWQLNCSADTFITEFSGWPRRFFDGALGLLARLRRSHRIGCLTNSNVLHWQRFNGLNGLFDVALSSHLLGLVKPDAECFDAAVAACGVPAAHIHFFDDSLPNVTAARDRGINAWHVDGLKETEAALEAIGICRDEASSR